MGIANDGTLWLAAINLIIWTGLFLYLLRIEGKLNRASLTRPEEETHDGK